jgi:hypothetical protein
MNTLTGQKGLSTGRKIELLLNCHESLILKKEGRFVCRRQNVCLSALNADKCLLSELLSTGIFCRQENQTGSFAVYEGKQ